MFHFDAPQNFHFMCIYVYVCCYISVVAIATGTGSSLSPLGLAASSAPGMIPLDDDGHPDMVSVVGRGKFCFKSRQSFLFLM